MLDMNKYKDAIVQAAWDSGVLIVGTTDYDISSNDDIPVLRLGIASAVHKDEIAKAFTDSLDKSLGGSSPFGVVAMSPMYALGMSVMLYKDNRWVYDS